MNTLTPYKFSEIDFNKIVYTKIKKNSKKKIIYIKYDDREKLRNLVFQTPSVLSMYEPELKDNFYEFDLSLIFKDEEKGALFIDFLKNLDEKILYDVNNNCTSWFDDLSSEVLYKNIINEDEICENGTINLKIIKSAGFETIIKLDDKKVSINKFKDNLLCKMILECFAIIITNDNKISLFLRPIIISLKNKEIENYNYDFYESEDDYDTKNLFIKEEEKIQESNNIDKSEELSSTSSEEN